ncbi:mannose-1-phosphate guanylyltransferase [Brachybacterium sp. JHP9]|uniref:Mannose-1-phosphate guanylyltransferase n=1 Tax=Brachybacterium equifaecis TaxID=2910770 RepID=A0ABT0R4C2_9MICO|nr:mannose-1-phosphate guanylyltransferase [Brachybacterium equifaecis]MCL6424268.1 mannose-1-phosphate guanylyltransferase [Brachybacterium equifaecis]
MSDSPAPASPFVPVVPAGGAGTRLWPLSRAARPKFLLDLTGAGESLLQQTLRRLAPLADRSPIVVTGAAHEAAVREQSGEGVRVLAEPSARNSMPAIALAAALAAREDEDAVIGSFAADHLIRDTSAFEQAVRSAHRAAELGYLVTLGVQPTHAATGFGYIEQAAEGSALVGPLPDLAGTGARPVAAFVEKPDLARAEEFLASGRHSWNAGMFVVRANVLLDALAEQIPALADGARRIAAAIGTDAEQQVLAELWPTLTSIAIDHALAEPLAAQGRVAVVPAPFDWDDVGDLAALARQLRERGSADGTDGGDGADGAGPVPSAEGIRVLGSARTLALDAQATVYGSSERLIALVGVERLSVVETDDVLLILADDHAQSLSSLVKRLEGEGLGDLR